MLHSYQEEDYYDSQTWYRAQKQMPEDYVHA